MDQKSGLTHDSMSLFRQVPVISHTKRHSSHVGGNAARPRRRNPQSDHFALGQFAVLRPRPGSRRSVVISTRESRFSPSLPSANVLDGSVARGSNRATYFYTVTLMAYLIGSQSFSSIAGVVLGEALQPFCFFCYSRCFHAPCSRGSMLGRTEWAWAPLRLGGLSG